MNEIKLLAPYVLGWIIAYFLKDLSEIEEYGPWILPFFYIIVFIIYLIGKARRFRNRIFIASRFDRWSRFITLIFGIVIIGLVINYNLMLFIGSGIFLLLGTIAIMSGIFYERSIQLEIKGNQLLIEYRGKSKTKLERIDRYATHDDTLEIQSGDKCIIIYDIKPQPDNHQKIVDVINKFKKVNSL